MNSEYQAISPSMVVFARYSCDAYGLDPYSATCAKTATVGVPNTGIGAYAEKVQAGDPWALTSVACGLILVVAALTMATKTALRRLR